MEGTRVVIVGSIWAFLLTDAYYFNGRLLGKLFSKIYMIWMPIFIFLYRLTSAVFSYGDERCPKCGNDNLWVSPMRGKQYFLIKCDVCKHQWHSYPFM